MVYLYLHLVDFYGKCIISANISYVRGSYGNRPKHPQVTLLYELSTTSRFPCTLQIRIIIRPRYLTVRKFNFPQFRRDGKFPPEIPEILTIRKPTILWEKKDSKWRRKNSRLGYLCYHSCLAFFLGGWCLSMLLETFKKIMFLFFHNYVSFVENTLSGNMIATLHGWGPSNRAHSPCKISPKLLEVIDILDSETAGF